MVDISSISFDLLKPVLLWLTVTAMGMTVIFRCMFSGRFLLAIAAYAAVAYLLFFGGLGAVWRIL